ncbi:MAG: hypothetical protein AB2806_06790 [Candidatus Thiodiazotropha sp.]
MTDQQFDPYDRAVELAERWLDKGYIDAWFKWLGWITLTSILFSVAIKAPTVFFKIIVGFPAVISLLMMYFSGIVAASKLKIEIDNKNINREKTNKIISFVFGVIIPSVLVYVIIIVIFTLIDM